MRSQIRNAVQESTILFPQLLNDGCGLDKGHAKEEWAESCLSRLRNNNRKCEILLLLMLVHAPP
jgi:hypothetical protein